jgi:hypothetical protein
VENIHNDMIRINYEKKPGGKKIYIYIYIDLFLKKKLDIYIYIKDQFGNS